MKTRRAINAPGHAHELTFSCYRRLPLLSRDRTRQWLIDALSHVRETHSVALLAYVVMPEHVHVLLLPKDRDYDMARILKSLKQPVARKALYRLRKDGSPFLGKLEGALSGGKRRHHFWQPGGGYDRNVTEPGTLYAMVEYIHANPVRRGLVGKPTDWRWSSAGWYAGMRDVPIVMDQVLV